MDFKNYIISLPSFIHYKSDEEYRGCVRHIFRFDLNETYSYEGKLTNFSQLDVKTQDELLFDNKALTESMDRLYEDTIKEPFFQDLYLHAAGQMFSTDPKIGQAVLCSYDTLHMYYACVWFFYVGGVSALLSCAEYKKLNHYFIRGA